MNIKKKTKFALGLAFLVTGVVGLVLSYSFMKHNHSPGWPVTVAWFCIILSPIYFALSLKKPSEKQILRNEANLEGDFGGLNQEDDMDKKALKNVLPEEQHKFEEIEKEKGTELSERELEESISIHLNNAETELLRYEKSIDKMNQNSILHLFTKIQESLKLSIGKIESSIKAYSGEEDVIYRISETDKHIITSQNKVINQRLKTIHNMKEIAEELRTTVKSVSEKGELLNDLHRIMRTGKHVKDDTDVIEDLEKEITKLEKKIEIVNNNVIKIKNTQLKEFEIMKEALERTRTIHHSVKSIHSIFKNHIGKILKMQNNIIHLVNEKIYILNEVEIFERKISTNVKEVISLLKNDKTFLKRAEEADKALETADVAMAF